MTCQCRSMSRTFCASMIQRLVSQAHGHSGSNQKSTRAVTGAVCTASLILFVLLEWLRRPEAAGVPARSQVPELGWHSQRPAPASGRHGKLPCVAVPNLTRAEAAARAELLEVQSYDLQLDVTDGAGRAGTEVFRSVTTVEFTAQRPG